MKMGLQFGLEKGHYCKRQFRWMFQIPDVCGPQGGGVNSLPPEKGARPNLAFKEMNVNHFNEEVFYPAKPDWKPISLTLYDLKKPSHPVFDWIKEVYKVDASSSSFKEPNSGNFIKTCFLEMLDAVGEVIEFWVFEDAWIQSANFQTLDMGTTGVAMCEISLRYARAYIS